MGERQAAMRLPLVRQVMDLFDATIVQVKAENVLILKSPKRVKPPILFTNPANPAPPCQAMVSPMGFPVMK